MWIFYAHSFKHFGSNDHHRRPGIDLLRVSGTNLVHATRTNLGRISTYDLAWQKKSPSPIQLILSFCRPKVRQETPEFDFSPFKFCIELVQTEGARTHSFTL